MIAALLNNWKLIAIGLLLAALTGTGAYIKYQSGRNNTLVSEKADLSAALQITRTSVVNLQLAIDEQNIAVEKLKDAATERAKANAAIIAKAKIEAANYKKRATNIIAAQKPQDITSCDAANNLFNAEITNAK